jgi:glucitol operon activator protein
MPLWQIGLILLVAAWAVQSAGVWLQMRHYQKKFGELRTRWTDGAMGAGAAPGRFGKGVIALVVTAPDGTIRKVCVMQGRSVFAKLKDRVDFEGLSSAELKRRAASGNLGAGVGVAIAKALEQIETVGKAAGESKPNFATA